LFRQWEIAQLTHWDNLFYQYQQGFLDSEYYEDEFKPRVRRVAPVWTALGLGPGRKSFAVEIERLPSKDTTRTAKPIGNCSHRHTDRSPEPYVFLHTVDLNFTGFGVDCGDLSETGIGRNSEHPRTDVASRFDGDCPFSRKDPGSRVQDVYYVRWSTMFEVRTAWRSYNVVP